MRLSCLCGFAVALGVTTAVVAQTTSLSPSELAWLKANAIEVKTVEAGSGFADLLKLKAAIGDARVVSLGEATHGTREIFQLKHRLTEFLASELGFTIFSIEANMPEAYRMNDYVLHGRGDPKALLRGMYFWTWNTEEVLGMVEWMRRFNASGKGRIQFTGFDMQTTSMAVQIVEDFLRNMDAEYAPKARSVYEDAAYLRPVQSTFGVATGIFPTGPAAGKKVRFSGAIKTRELEGFAGLWWRAQGPKGVLAFDNMETGGPRGTSDWKRYELVLDIPSETVHIEFGLLMPGTGTAWFDDLRVEIDGRPCDDAAELFDFDFESGQIRLSTLAPGYWARIDDSTRSRGTRSLRIESKASGASPRKVDPDPLDAGRSFSGVVAHMEAARGEYLKRADAKSVDWAIQNARLVHQHAQMMSREVSRDESMARNVKWILDTAPKGSRIVLWAHNAHVGRTQLVRSRPMGAYLHDWYGKDHVVVGFALNRGEYTALGAVTGVGPYPLTPAGSGSYEYAFALSRMPRFILDLRLARAEEPDSRWLRTPMQLRAIGATAMVQQFRPVNLARLFDMIAFLDETTPTRRISTVIDCGQ